MALVRSLSGLASALVVSSVVLLAGCGGKSIGDDLTVNPNPTDPRDPRDPRPIDPPNCDTSAPACDFGDESALSEASCKGADYCYSRAHACNGAVVWCAHRNAQCDAVPSCDKGDTQVKSCPGGTGISCYPRTLCGSTITCMHRDACLALPECDPGDKEVVDISTCKQPGAACYSRTACNFTIWCN